MTAGRLVEWRLGNRDRVGHSGQMAWGHDWSRSAAGTHPVSSLDRLPLEHRA